MASNQEKSDHIVREKQQPLLDVLIAKLGQSGDQQALEKVVHVVNELQDELRRLRRQTFIAQDMRDPEWQKLNSVCDDTEKQLIALLSNGNLRKTPQAQNTLELSISRLLDSLHDTEKGQKLSKDVSLRPVAAIFNEWGALPVEQGRTKALQATLEKYGEGFIQKIDARLDMLETLPPTIRQQIFGSATIIDRRQIAGQLINGTLKDSDHAFLLQEPEKVLAAYRASTFDQVKKHQTKLEELQSNEHERVKQLAALTQAKAAEPDIEAAIAAFRTIQTDIADQKKKLTPFASTVVQLDIGLAIFQAKIFKNRGQIEQADRIILKTWEEFPDFGGNEKFQKEYELAYIDLIAKGKLTEFERNHYIFAPREAQNGRGISEYGHNRRFEAPIEALRAYAERMDLLDQYRSAEGKDVSFQVDKYKLPKPTEGFAVELRVSGQPLKGKIMDYISSRPVGENKTLQYNEVYPQGWRPAFDKKLDTIKTPSGKTFEGIYIDPSARQFLQQKPPSGTTIILKRELRNIRLGKPYNEAVQTSSLGGMAFKEVRFVEDYDTLTIKDLVYAQIESGKFSVKKTNGGTEFAAPVHEVEKGYTENANDVLRAIDTDEQVRKVIDIGGKVQSNLENLAVLFSAGMQGKKWESYVQLVRVQARTLKDIFNNPEAGLAFMMAKQRLKQLKQLNLGLAYGQLDQKIDQRIKALEVFTAMFESGEIRHMMDIILDKSEFHPDTFGIWLKTEGPKILAMIMAAAAAVITITLTFGLATPLWILAAGSAAGGMIGYELAAEAGYHLHQKFDQEVVSGDLMAGDRSRLGKYIGGAKIYDPVKGEYIDMSFLKDVVGPYTRDFLISWVTSFATMGFGKIVASRLSLLIKNSCWMKTLAIRGPLLNRITTSLSKLQSAHATQPGLIKQFAEETLGGIKDEATQEGVQYALAKIEARLGILSAFILATGKGFQPINVRQYKGKYLGELTYVAGMGNTSSPNIVEKWALEEGYTVIVHNRHSGVIDVRTYAGDYLRFTPGFASSLS